MAHYWRIPAVSAASCCLAAGATVLGLGGAAWAQTGGVYGDSSSTPAGTGTPPASTPAAQGTPPAGTPGSSAPGSTAPGGTPAGGDQPTPSGGSGSTSAAGDAPPGNNGHIQIDEYSMDAGNDNDPHVSCDFSVSFFGYDGGAQQATITVTPWAPTGGGHPGTFGPVSWDVGTRTSGSQLDANYQVTEAQLATVLAGVTPAAQGVHLRVEVEVTGSRGADDKFKMLWLSPCGPGAPPAVSPGGGSTTTTTTTSPDHRPPFGIETAGTGGGPSIEALSAAVTSTTYPLLHASPAVLRSADTPARGRLAGALAFTGAAILALVLGGLTLVGAGSVLTYLGRRRRTA